MHLPLMLMGRSMDFLLLKSTTSSFVLMVLRYRLRKDESSNSLYTVREKVSDPAAGGKRKSDIQQFYYSSVLEHDIIIRAKVNKKQPGVMPLWFQV